MGAHIIPTLRYRDAAAAIDWLCRAFGFARHLVVPGENSAIAHAQLTLGTGMIMVGSVRDDEFGQLQTTPAQVGGVGTRSPYIVVPDADFASRARRLRWRPCCLRPERRGLRRSRIFLPRSRRASLELRHVRPVEVTDVA